MATETDKPTGADVPAGNGTAAPSTPPATPAADATGKQPDVWRNVDEIKDTLKEVRELRRQLQEATGRTPKPAETPASATTTAPADPVAELRAEMALKDAIADADLGQHRKRVERLWRAERPQDVAVWLKATAEEMGWKPGTETPVVKTPDQVPPTETPPPSPATQGRSIPSNPSALTKEQIEGMSEKELKAHWEAFKRSSGTFVHPLAQFKRERAAANGQAETIGRAIAEALSRR